MNGLIGWLLQPTQNGATYLQVLIAGIVMCVVMRFLIDTIKEIIDSNGRDEYESEQETESKKDM